VLLHVQRVVASGSDVLHRLDQLADRRGEEPLQPAGDQHRDAQGHDHHAQQNPEGLGELPVDFVEIRQQVDRSDLFAVPPDVLGDRHVPRVEHRIARGAGFHRDDDISGQLPRVRGERLPAGVVENGHFDRRL